MTDCVTYQHLEERFQSNWAASCRPISGFARLHKKRSRRAQHKVKEVFSTGCQHYRGLRWLYYLSRHAAGASRRLLEDWGGPDDGRRTSLDLRRARDGRHRAVFA